MRTLATFWDGARLPPLDQACLLSFVHHGFDVQVFSYVKIENLHSDLRPRNAADIVDQSYTTQFRIAGRPSLSHFSDIFRYRLFETSDCVWIDTDLLCLKSFEIPATGNFLTLETPSSLNGAISRLDPQITDLQAILAEVEALAGRDLKWGATGPALITKQLGAAAIAAARPPEEFYPFHWNEWYLPFLPEAAVRCITMTAQSSAIHLWNNIVEKAGYWKDLAPPEGSLLHQRIDALNLLPLFRATLPLKVMQQLVLNYQNLQSAAHLTVPALSKILQLRLAAATRRRLSAIR